MHSEYINLDIPSHTSAMPNRNERRKRCLGKDDYDIWKLSKNLRHEQHKLEKMEKKGFDDERAMSSEIEKLKEEAVKPKSSLSTESESAAQKPVEVPLDKYLNDMKAKLNM